MARVLLRFLRMVLDIVPRISGMKIESPWQKGLQGLVQCTFRLTRSLTSAEGERLQVLLGVVARGKLLQYVCRPEEVEDSEERLSLALAQAVRRSGGARHLSQRPTNRFVLLHRPFGQ